MSNKGSCLCGEVQFEIEGDFNKFFLCHCSRCRKGTGTAHAANLFSSTATINWLSGKERIKTYHLPETQHARSFCTNCGSVLPIEIAGGKLIMVPAGGLDDDVSIKPTAHIFMDDRANWEDSLNDTERFKTIPK
ncbi:GFA family protein [Kangiella sediminilitoris]|uniref:Aldehyde-activating protein n=1 Tax=Kangiella sediminilitoris TaxID=1144748 RepID=A0A1B3BCN8_9GAMM|nr:GFA family protein [Kangiella sediminilitoris]AOE50579.1 aldehyde-activating protein [Kangiella sediminilitoris]